MSDQRKYRKHTPQQKLEVVVAGLRGDKTIREICREHDISENLYYQWRDKLLEAGKVAFAGKDEHQREKELQTQIRRLERSLGKKTLELEIAGEALRGWE
ncbi:MAG: transposase [Solirubrobacterales bacterium]